MSDDHAPRFFFAILSTLYKAPPIRLAATPFIIFQEYQEMSTSSAQIEANRANAQSSTGPRTPEGKQRSCLNATRHGLTSQNPLLPTEDPEAYQKFCDEYVADLKPKGAIEQQLALSMAGMHGA